MLADTATGGILGYEKPYQHQRGNAHQHSKQPQHNPGRLQGPNPLCARILWHLLKYRQPYNPSVWQQAEARLKQKKIKRLHQNAAALGFKLVSTP